MKSEILNHLDQPEQLEALYRKDKAAFKVAFHELRPEFPDHVVLSVWEARLNYGKIILPTGKTNEILLVLLLAVLSGLFAKLPAFSGVEEDHFYLRNFAFFVFPALSLYFLWREKAGMQLLVGTGVAIGLLLIYINVLPFDLDSDTFVLTLLHQPLLLWGLTGLAFMGSLRHAPIQRLDYLHYNGDLIVISTLIGLACMVVTGMTIGLFELIDINITEWYFENLVVFCLPAIPIAGTFLIKNNPQIVGKIAPLIARIFSPIVLVMLTIYLFAMVFTGKEDPYNDREFLFLFNLLLIGVMALMIFSLAGQAEASQNRLSLVTLFLLAMVTILINSIALSAILFRIANYGITPNRAAVMGSNLLMLVNLLWVAFRMLQFLRKSDSTLHPGEAIGRFLPLYVLWVGLVTFGFPLIFGME